MIFTQSWLLLAMFIKAKNIFWNYDMAIRQYLSFQILVYWSAVFLHLQLLLEPQNISSWQDFNAWCNVYQWGSYESPVITQTQSFGDGSTGSGTSIFTPDVAPCYTSLYMCCIRAACLTNFSYGRVSSAHCSLWCMY